MFIHQDESYDESILDISPDASSGIAIQGYLYKRASNAFKTWSRCSTSPLNPPVLLYLSSYHLHVTKVIINISTLITAVFF